MSSKGHRKDSPAKKKRTHPGRRPSVAEESEILALVRKGVKNFIFEKATIRDFLNGLRDISPSNRYPHQLTRAVFTKIVREAIRKRNARSTGRD